MQEMMSLYQVIHVKNYLMSKKKMLNSFDDDGMSEKLSYFFLQSLINNANTLHNHIQKKKKK